MRRIVVRDLIEDSHGAPLVRNVVLRVLVPQALQSQFADPNKASTTPDFTTAAELADLRAGLWFERFVALDARGKTNADLQAAALAALQAAQQEMDAAGPDRLYNYCYDDVSKTWVAPS